MISSALPPDEVLQEMQTLVSINTYTCGSRARNNLQSRTLVTFRRKLHGGQGPPFSNQLDLYRWLYENKRQTWKSYVKLNSEKSIAGTSSNNAPQPASVPEPLTINDDPISQGSPISQEYGNKRV
jgi:hypothetical protein